MRSVSRCCSGALAHGQTYMSHAVGCAGSLAVLEAFEDEQLLGRVKSQGANLEEALRARFGSHPNVGDIRGRGLFWSLELVADRPSKRAFPTSLGLAARIKATALAGGLICYPSAGTPDGAYGDNVLLAPPYIIGAGEIAELVDKLALALDASLAALPGAP